MEMSQSRSALSKENMQNGVSEAAGLTGCPWKAQTLYHRSLGSASQPVSIIPTESPGAVLDCTSVYLHLSKVNQWLGFGKTQRVCYDFKTCVYLLNNILTLKMYTSKLNPRRNSVYRPFSTPDRMVISTSSNKKKSTLRQLNVVFFAFWGPCQTYIDSQQFHRPSDSRKWNSHPKKKKNINTKSQIAPGMHSTSLGHDGNTV